MIIKEMPQNKMEGFDSSRSIPYGMKKVILLLTLFLVLPTLGFSHGGDEEEHIVRMTNNGFEPATLTIGEGEEVIFINDDDTDRWPASNLHPTHGLYPEFDPQKSLKPGDLWAFVFDKPGTWRMHDHLIPRMTGTIIVLEGVEEEGDEKEVKRTDNDTGFLGGLIGAIKIFFERLSSIFRAE